MKKIAWMFISRFLSHPPINDEDIGIQQDNLLQEYSNHHNNSLFFSEHGWNHTLFQWLCNMKERMQYCIETLWLSDYSSISHYINTGTLTIEKPLYMGRTSWTSDGNTGGKDIPITKLSLDTGEVPGMKHILWHIIPHIWLKPIILGKALVLSASCDGYQGYISWIIRHYTHLISNSVSFPSSDRLMISDWSEKKQICLQTIKEQWITLTSCHGVPCWPLELLDDLIQYDPLCARKTLRDFCYVSIWWWPPLEYKQRFKKLLESIDLHQSLYAVNNHTATEWFFGSQMRNFTDLEFHWMKPYIRGNRFGYIDYSTIDSTQPLNVQSLNVIPLGEVKPGIEYLQVTINHRIPVPYVIKDLVTFNEHGEYLVTGRMGMASNVANEHIEQKHILNCLKDLRHNYQWLSTYFALAGMELTDDHKLIFHRLIEYDKLSDNQIIYNTSDISKHIHHRFIAHHEQYRNFATKGKIISCQVTLLSTGSLINSLTKLWRRHGQSKIPHIGNSNYRELIVPIRKLM